MTTTASGLLDTNVIIHAYATDRWSGECRAFLAALRDGRVRAHLDPLVLHELSYALPRYMQQLQANRQELAAFLLMILAWQGIEGDKETMIETIQRWAGSPGLAFVDAYLAVRAGQRACPIYTKNARELERQGIDVPQTLPSGA
jgi:predicted nucleic acid-binding protein